MTPLEAAARAACRTDYGGPDECREADIDGLWRDYLPIARAVLGAVREPSEQMVWGARQVFRRSSHPAGIEDAATIWIAMVDVLLAEQPWPAA